MHLIACDLSKQVLDEDLPFVYKNHESCDYWASHDNECVKNPRYMWSGCFSSCVQYAVNQHELCDTWGNEGECSHNPNYVQVNCPKSCGMAIAWNPWVRRELGIQPLSNLDPALGQDEIDSQNMTIFDAAEVMRKRVHKYLSGLHSVVEGLTSTAPTDYLGMLGVTEAVLYAMRLHEALLQAHLTELAAHQMRLRQILGVLRQGYAADPLMRYLPHWAHLLDTSAEEVAGVLSGAQAGLDQYTGPHIPVSPILTTNQDPYQLTTYFLGNTDNTNGNTGNLNTVTVDLDGTNGVINTGKDGMVLSNGMVLPVLGLGTWQLTGTDCYHTVLTALRLGYRLIDTAQAYGNEAEVGQALRQALAEGVLRRDQAYLASKQSEPAPSAAQAYAHTQALVARQLALLQTHYLDLYFLHSEVAEEVLGPTWRALEDLVAEGRIRALGVSNFSPAGLKRLLALPGARIRPSVLQNKGDVYHLAKQLDNTGEPTIALAREEHIALMMYR